MQTLGWTLLCKRWGGHFYANAGGLGGSWGALGILGEVLGVSLGRLRDLGGLGRSWGRLGAVLGPSWGRLGVVLGHKGI